MTTICFRLRSSAFVRLPASRSTRRAMVAAVPATGARGLLARRAVHCVSGLLPVSVLRLAPGIAVVDDPDELATLDSIAPWLASHGFDPQGAIVTRPPADDTTGRFGALLRDSRGDFVAHLRVTTQNPPTAAPRDESGARTHIRWPMPLAHSDRNGQHLTLTSAMPVGLHRPTRLDTTELLDLVADITDTLGSTPSTPLMHGDLTPWNLRTYPDGARALFDWEFAGPGPRHADIVRYMTALPNPAERFAELPPAVRRECGEAITYWRRLTEARGSTRGNAAWVARNRATMFETFDQLESALDS